VVARRNISEFDYPHNCAARHRQGLHYSAFCAFRLPRVQKNQWVTLRDNPKNDVNPLSSVNLDGSEAVSERSFATLKECTEDATLNGYVVWKSEQERRRGA
jgi:hypothetical protein